MPRLRNLDIDLLRAFVAIAQAKNISRAAERLLRNQSTVSLQLKRLEEAIGQKLFDRSPRRVELTPYGHTLLVYAQQILALNDEVVARSGEPEMEGTVRLGVPEDFATMYMPDVLGEFAKAYPLVALEVTCDLTLNLLERFRSGDFEIVLVKREPAARSTGVRVWREPLVWTSGAGFAPPKAGEIPLVVSPEPCVYRKRATEALTRARRPWRVAYTCASLAGAQAAVKAGLGLTVLPRDMVPIGLHVVAHGGLPDLKDTEIALIAKEPVSRPSARLREHIVSSLERAAENGDTHNFPTGVRKARRRS